MKKFILMVMLCMATMFASAQNAYVGQKFTDNWSVNVQGGVITGFDDMFGHVSPTIVVGADKYINPWLGFGVDGRTTIAAPSGKMNPHTVFDAVNVEGVAKVNVANLIRFNGNRYLFEPVIYTGLGWGHNNCSHFSAIAHDRNYLTYRAGSELNFNLGKQRAVALMVNPAVVWGGIDNFKLNKHHGHFELTAGVVYHFKTSNGTNHFTKARLYDQAEIDALNARIKELENKPAQVVEKIIEKPVTNTVKSSDATYAVNFAQNSAVLTDAAKAILDKVPTNATVNVAGSTSPEGTTKRNTALAIERAQAVANYLKNRGVTIDSVVGGEAGRVAVVTIK